MPGVNMATQAKLRTFEAPTWGYRKADDGEAEKALFDGSLAEGWQDTPPEGCDLLKMREVSFGDAFDSMSKEELETFALNTYGEEVNMRLPRSALVVKVRRLHERITARANAEANAVQEAIQRVRAEDAQKLEEEDREVDKVAQEDEDTPPEGRGNRLLRGTGETKAPEREPPDNAALDLGLLSKEELEELARKTGIDLEGAETRDQMIARISQAGGDRA